jgi:uncharacterized protein involved in outer membrane biogenesis
MKIFIKISGLALIVIVVGVVIFLFTLDVNQYKPSLIEAVSEQTGREFNIEGDLGIAVSLTPSITVSGISLGNATWGTDQNMLEVGRVEARVSLIRLFSGSIHINEFILHDTNINLEKDSTGSGNWVLDEVASSPAVDAEAASGSLPPISIEKIEIVNAHLSYRDQAVESVSEFDIQSFNTSITELEAPLSFELAADYDDIPISIVGTIDAIDTILAGDEFTLEIKGELGELEFTTTGSLASVTQTPTANITITAALSSLADLNGMSGSELPDIGPMNFSGLVKFNDPQEISVENIVLQLGDTSFSGTIGLNTRSDIPSISAKLTSPSIDIRPFMSETTEEQEFLFPRDELPLSELSSVNANLNFSTQELVLPSFVLEDNQLSVKLLGGNLQVVTDSGLAGGKLSTDIGIKSGNNNTATLTTNINGSEIMLEFLPHEEDRWFAGGSTDISINGSGLGKTVAEIMGSYNGNLLVKVGEATIPNDSIDLFGADILLSTFNKLNPLSGEEASTLLECAVINLPISDGMIKLDRQIAIQTSKMYMVGSGEINLKTEAINLGVRPYAMEGVGLNLSSIAGAAKIGGTLANPKAEIDAANALKAGASAGVAVVTGGLSLLAQGLFSKAGNDPEPCNTALGIVSASQPATPVESSGQNEEQNAGEKAIDGVKNTLKGLFGK